MTDPAPYFRIHAFVCINERPEGHERGSCARKDSVRLANYLKARAKELGVDGIRVNKAGCLDRCELGPVLVIYPDAVWYRFETMEDMDEILTTHVVDGGRVERLMLRPEDGPK